MKRFFRQAFLRFFIVPLLKLAIFPSYFLFRSNFKRLKKVQEKKLNKLCDGLKQTEFAGKFNSKGQVGYSFFVKAFGPSQYNDWLDFIEREKSGERVFAEKPFLYQPTSGSSHKEKWIPYTQSMMDEFKSAIFPWLFDLFQNFPEIGKGDHYWSLSWLPTNMRGKGRTNDDLSYFPTLHRWLIGKCLCVPPSVTLANTVEASRLATCVYLVTARNLTFIFIWGPTFFLELIEFMMSNRELIISMLEKGSWEEFSSDLESVKPIKDKESAFLLKSFKDKLNSEDLLKLWPRLSLISCWDTGTSSVYAKKLQDLFPRTYIQGKGLFATEGVVTIPFRGDYTLAYRSHFYEFLSLDSGKVIPAWELEVGMRVSPLISAGNGLLRYHLKDELRVEKGVSSPLSLVFQGRVEGLDMVGEKMGEEVARNLLESLGVDKKKPVSLLGVQNGQERPFYLALFQGEELEKDEIKSLEERGEEALLNHFHYKLARELNQLGHLRVKVFPAATDYYLDLKKKSGMVEGDIKIDLLTKVNNL
tara:strand:- start:2293 stop:3882 length:1590 start_codon:yes stop_codon:yes gene_type:complete